MHADSWLKAAEKRLEVAGVATARLDCLVLLEDATGKNRAWLLAHPEYMLAVDVESSLDAKLTQRGKHVPLAYIRGHVEFYGREFAVNAHTLVPRPETETMIDLLKQFAFGRPEPDPGSSQKNSAEGARYKLDSGFRRSGDLTIVDVGTGSGAIAVTAKLELSQANVIATDIDERCLETAHHNAQKLGADIGFLRGDLLRPLRGSKLGARNSILLCNLPYVPDNFQINTAATHEPRRALFGGADGLDLYRELFTQLKALGGKPAYVLTESLPPQHEPLAGVAEAAGFTLQKTDGFIQVFG